MNKSKIVMYVVLTPIALALFYGGKHIAHIKCVEGALDMQCKKSYQGYRRVETVDVPWWNPFNSKGYSCSAKVAFADGIKDIVFTAKRVSGAELVKDAATIAVTAKKATEARSEGDLDDLNRKLDEVDNWDVNMGFWGWLGDDYRIMNVKAK